MWLPEDERRLLAGYAYNIEQLNEPDWYVKASLFPFLIMGHEVGEKGGGPGALDANNYADFVENAANFFGFTNRVNTANVNLGIRGLVAHKEHGNDSTLVEIGLTAEGQKWGQRYQTSLGRLDARYREHQGGILELVVSFVLGGIVSGVIVGVVVAKIVGP